VQEETTMSDKNQQMEPLQKKELEHTAEATRTGVYYEPPVDIYETPDALHLVADMPGVASDGIEIDLREGVLTLLGRQSPVDEGHVSYREFRPGNWYRRFTLSEAIDQERIAANLSNGVLTVDLPKTEKVKPRKIQVAAT